MATLPWILFALAVVWHFSSQRLNHRKRNQLENYIVYLLLSDDDIRPTSNNGSRRPILLTRSRFLRRRTSDRQHGRAPCSR